MITLPFLLRQSTPSGCLPTTIRAVLLWALCEEAPEDCAENLVSERKITLLCHQDETVIGCDWDVALPELGQAYNVEDLTEDEEGIREIFQNVRKLAACDCCFGRSCRLRNRHTRGSNSGHHSQRAGYRRRNGCFLDPARGELREMRGIDFWSAWNLGGEYAFIIQP